MKLRPDGSLYTDNCPYRLRRIRNTVRKYAPWMFFFVSVIFGQSAADAQGLVGAPVDPRFGQSGEVGLLVDNGYDPTKDVVHGLTALSGSMAVVALAVQRVKDGQTIALLKNKLGDCRLKIKNYVRNRMIQVVLMIAVPIAVYFISPYVIRRICLW